jgi:hypothetical protein
MAQDPVITLYNTCVSVLPGHPGAGPTSRAPVPALAPDLGAHHLPPPTPPPARVCVVSFRLSLPFFPPHDPPIPIHRNAHHSPPTQLPRTQLTTNLLLPDTHTRPLCSPTKKTRLDAIEPHHLNIIPPKSDGRTVGGLLGGGTSSSRGGLPPRPAHQFICVIKYYV